MQGGFDVTQHILNKQRSQFAFIGEAGSQAPEFKERYLCHCKALKHAGLEVNSSMQFDAISTEQSGYQAAQNLIDTGNIFNAVLCASDLIALGALRCLREKGLNIPQDVAIAGFDNIPISSFANPALTTVHQNTKLAGEILVNSLLKLINGEKVSHYLMPVDLVVRQSCGTLT
jgi:DNA-binding LacI/PurR family transcriptional regulator